MIKTLQPFLPCSPLNLCLLFSLTCTEEISVKNVPSFFFCFPHKSHLLINIFNQGNFPLRLFSKSVLSPLHQSTRCSSNKRTTCEKNSSSLTVYLKCLHFIKPMLKKWNSGGAWTRGATSGNCRHLSGTFFRIWRCRLCVKQRLKRNKFYWNAVYSAIENKSVS